MEQKFELDLRMSDSGVVCNAQTLKEMLPEKLKPYNYVVTENNYADAKTDRTKLNNLYSAIQAKRKQFEETDLKEWKMQKAIIMDIEKMVKEASDALGEGIKAVDEKAKLEKMESVREAYKYVSKSMPLDIPFESLYDRKKYDPKAMTVKKIQDDLSEKVKKIVQDWKMLEAYMPDDQADIEQVKKVFIDTLEVGRAKAKADELKAIRAMVSKQIDENAKAVKETMEPSIKVAKQAPVQEKVIKQRILFEIIAERPFFDDMNQLILKYRPQVKVIEKEDI